MDNVKYIFIDPGLANFGLVLLSTKNGTVTVRKMTIDIGKNVMDEMTAIEKLITGLDLPVYVYSEENFFQKSPNLSNDLAVAVSCLEAFLIMKFNLKNGDMVSSSIMATNLKQRLKLIKNDNAKKIIQQAFLNVTDFKKCTFHESDAFCAGAVLVSQDSKQHNKDIVELCELFLYYVDQLRQSPHVEDNPTNAKSPDRVQPSRAKKPKSDDVPRVRNRRPRVRTVQKSTNNTSQIGRYHKWYTSAKHKRNGHDSSSESDN